MSTFNIIASTAAVGAGAVGAGVVAPIPTDWTGIALTITAVGSVVSIVLGGIAAWRAGKAEKHSVAAQVSADEAKQQSIETSKAVDGKMEKVVEMISEKVTAEATLKEKDAQASREAVAAKAVKEATEKAPQQVELTGTPGIKEPLITQQRAPRKRAKK